MSVGQVEQVPQSAAPPVPPLVADAVFQYHVVGPHRLQDVVNVLRGALSIHLIDLRTANIHRPNPLLHLVPHQLNSVIV